jgi:putative DNA primase/helicase
VVQLGDREDGAQGIYGRAAKPEGEKAMEAVNPKQPKFTAEQEVEFNRLFAGRGRKANRQRPANDAGEEPIPPAFTDDALALRFAEAHGQHLRYVAAWDQWLEWDGSRWNRDETYKTLNHSRRLCREASAECNEPGPAVQIARIRTIKAVIDLARADRQIASTAHQWDADPWVLNTPGGAVDLGTGQIRPARQEDYATKCTAVAPSEAEPRTFLAFLERVTGGDCELQGFLRRLLGYALTGVTREHALAFFYGTGGNGKSVLLNTVSGILGDYATTAPIDLFMASHSEQHPTGLAGLRGARLVTAIETDEGRRWAESKIKTLTGGDKIAARFMRQDFFEFVPQFKLVIAGNHKPGLRSVDEAIRRRMHLVPFDVTIPAEERDGRLPEKLQAEWPAILGWMIQGCLEWQREGLAAPEAVRAATEAYLDSEDSMAIWIGECCQAGGGFDWESNTALWRSWQSWAEAAGEKPGSQKRFVQGLKARGFVDRRRHEGRGFEGLRLRTHVA